MKISVTINGEQKQLVIQPNEILLDVLRREGYRGVKAGCRSGDCGACTVIVNGKAVDSCLMMAAQVEGAEVTTIEGLALDDRLHPLQQAFLDHGAAQCGFCIPGMLLSAKDFLDERQRLREKSRAAQQDEACTREQKSSCTPCAAVTEKEVREALVGNLCRCTGYKKQVEAILAVANNNECL